MPRWSEAARRKQAELIRTWKPWTRSTGPKSSEGKKTSSKNKSPSDFVVLPGLGIFRNDTKSGRRAIAEFEQRRQYERECLKQFGEILPSYSDLKRLSLIGKNE